MRRERVDFGVIHKTYSRSQLNARDSSAKTEVTTKKVRFGNPDEDPISNSHVERLNLTTRMNYRRFTRLTNAHGKGLKHHVAMQNSFIAWYNLYRRA